MQQAASSYKEITDNLNNTEVTWKTFPQNM